MSKPGQKSSLARETVYKYLFARNFNGEDPKLYRVLSEEAGLNGESKAFADSLLKSVISHYDTLLQKVESIVDGYKLERIYTTDKCALVLAIAELTYFDTPKPVVIDEMVSLSSIYSTEKSSDFVNGVLAKYIKEN